LLSSDRKCVLASRDTLHRLKDINYNLTSQRKIRNSLTSEQMLNRKPVAFCQSFFVLVFAKKWVQPVSLYNAVRFLMKHDSGVVFEGTN
jgi:hypothetical protein